jgi:hypothetical protein
MKEEMNNEMDLLLRRLSRRQDGVLPEAGSGINREHLDADELSSYAENALPVVARARYTEHLVECASCRDLVVQLTASAGVVVAVEQKGKTPAPSGWRNLLASLFSPMVLRYSVPALGLIVVAAIGFVLMNRESGFLAEQKSAPVATQADESQVTPEVAPEAERTTGFLDRQDASNQGLRPIQPKAPATTRPEKESAEPSSVPNQPPGVTISAEAKKAAPAEEQTGARAAAAQPEAAPAPTSDFHVEIDKRKQESDRQISQSAKVALERANDQAKAQDRRAGDVAGRSAARNEAPSPAKAPAPSAGSIAPLRGATPGERDRSDAEDRSVAGRRFRRERGIWIDTGYSSGTSTVNVARDSEQYRALIADEPSLKTIAEALDGQIIVVWKGRAYRIR